VHQTAVSDATPPKQAMLRFQESEVRDAVECFLKDADLNQTKMREVLQSVETTLGK